MDWKTILATVIPFLVAALGALSPVIINWLKTQKFVQKAHLENIISALIPQIIEWVEYWAEELAKKGEKPTSEQKLAKAVEFLKNEVNVPVSTEIVSRIEAALKKIK